MILYLRYCRTGVLFHITVHVKDQYVTTYDDVILVKPNRICTCRCHTSTYCMYISYRHVGIIHGNDIQNIDGYITMYGYVVVQSTKGTVPLHPCVLYLR